MSIDTERARLRVRIMAAITTVEDVCWLTQTAGAAEVKSSAEAAARRWVAVAAPLADPGHLECPGCGALEGDMSAEPQADAIPIRVARSFP